MAEEQQSEEVQRWTAKHRAALLLSLLKGETTAALAEAGYRYEDYIRTNGAYRILSQSDAFCSPRAKVVDQNVCGSDQLAHDPRTFRRFQVDRQGALVAIA